MNTEIYNTIFNNVIKKELMLNTWFKTLSNYILAYRYDYIINNDILAQSMTLKTVRLVQPWTFTYIQYENNDDDGDE